jgi:hypothetical protein
MVERLAILLFDMVLPFIKSVFTPGIFSLNVTIFLVDNVSCNFFISNLVKTILAPTSSLLLM